MTRKLILFKGANNQKFEEFLTEKEAREVISVLNYNSSGKWIFQDATEEMNRYNSIVTSPDYKREINQMKEVYAGSNLKMRVNAFHKRLGIRELETRDIFETFNIEM